MVDRIRPCFVETMNTDQIAALESRVRCAGVVQASIQGAEKLAQNSVTHEQLADKFDGVLSGDYSNKFDVTLTTLRGGPTCPVERCTKKMFSLEAKIENQASGETLRVSALTPHLLRHHHLFLGVGVGLDPQIALDVLGMAKQAS